MSANVHPLAPEHLPSFIPGPDGSDPLLWITIIVTIAIAVLLGVMFLWLHTLPERLGHKKLQFEVVAVLGLLALFTHIHLFWVIGLLLALVDLPDIQSPLRRIASAAEKLADMEEQPAETPLPTGDVPTQIYAPPQFVAQGETAAVLKDQERGDA